MMRSYLDLIRGAYPEFEIKSARPIMGSGQFSVILVINEKLVFRFPRTDEVALGMAREIAILKQIQGRFAVPIPDPIFSVIDVNTGRQVLMGYPMISGEPASRDIFNAANDSTVQQFASDVVDFVRGLHSIKPSSLNMVLPVEGMRREWIELYSQFRDELYPFMRLDAQAQVSAVFDAALSDVNLWEFEPVMRHGDLGTSNILVEPATMAVSGIIDFGMCGLGDPAQDIAALWNLSDRFMQSFFVLYPEMRVTIPRAKFIRSTYALQQALYALHLGNKRDFDDGIQSYV